MSARSLMKASAVIGFTTVMLIAVPTSYAASAADCAARADRAERDATSTAGGAARGAGAGLLFGAIVGDSSKSAGRGALLGGVVGGARQSSQRNDIYRRVYDDCMRGY
ncbi:MAG: hypothetical protein OQL16_10065 [Gammaproteobacteria bacterium]|nr:hypothetical protein [Gammaproteobacteria bacterium]